MRRRSQMDDSSDSLELFLDTVCNAFGGIIFISLLLCIMLQQAGEKFAPWVEDKAQLTDRLTGLEREIQALETVHGKLKEQRDNIPESDPGRIRKYRRLEQEQRELEKIQQELADALGILRIEIKTQGPFLAQLEEDKKDLEAEQSELEEAFNEIRVPVNVRFPRARRAEKTPVYILLEGGRFAFVHEFDERGRVLGDNEGDISSVNIRDDDGAGRHLRLKPGGGQAVTDDPQFAKGFTATISRFVAQPTPENGVQESDCHYFPVVVWPDSYTQFEVLRDLLLERGFGYGLILMEENQPAKMARGVEKPADL